MAQDSDKELLRAVQLAQQAYYEAPADRKQEFQQRYREALRQFSDLVLRGKQPDNEPAAPRTVLIIDQNAGFVEKLESVLTEAGYRVLKALSGEEGLRTLDSRHAEIDVLVVDPLLPEGPSGFNIIGAMSRRQRMMKIMAGSTGYPEPYLSIAKYMGANTAVKKPDPQRSIDGQQWLNAIQTVFESERALGKAAG